MNINMKHGDAVGKYKLPPSVVAMVWIILGVVLAIGLMIAALLIQVVIYFCVLIAGIV